MERVSKCGACYNLHEINFEKAMGLQQITKTLTIFDFLGRCTGLRVDRGALGANAQIKNDLWVQCTEGAEKHRGFHAHARKTHLWVIKPVHLLLHGRERNSG
jgi:hypothetical protein